MLSNIAQKREQFVLGLKRSAREEVFRKNRFPNKDIIPFSQNSQYMSQSYYESFEKANQLKINFQGDQMELDESITSYIFLVQQLSNFLDEDDCNEELNTQHYVQVIFKIFNLGYPQIDKSCLHVLLAFSAENHEKSEPIQEHLDIIVDYFNQTTYIQLKQYILDILANIAVDCYICRDLVMLLQIPQRLWKEVQRCNNKSVFEDYFNLITNLDRIKPELNKQKLSELHTILQELFLQCQNEKQKQWLLKLMNRIYSYDKAKVEFQFLDYLLSNEFESIELMQEVFKYFHYISLLDVEINNQFQIQIIRYLIQNLNKYLQFENIKAGQIVRLIRRVFTTIENLIVDDPELTNLVLQHGMLEYCQHTPDILLQKEFFSLVRTMMKFCSSNEIKQMNSEYQLMKTVVEQLHCDGLDQQQELLSDIFKIILRLLLDDQFNLQIFNEEDGESKICQLQRKVNEENNEMINCIFNLLDQ